MVWLIKKTILRKILMKNKAFIYIIIAGLLWGTSGIFVHYLAPLGLSPLQMASIRGTVAACFMVDRKTHV